MNPYHPVVVLPIEARVLDLSRPAEPDAASPRWSIGRYDEDRAIYTQALFGARTVHLGVDLGAPAGVAVHAFADGEVILQGVNPAPGDYGPTLVCAHRLRDGREIVALYGHLSAASLARSPVGRRFKAGDVLGWLGERDENGGWPPHVHFQLAWERPSVPDLPGVAARADREAMLARFPDPRMVLGPLW